jgi:pSer/pThr/pTyr-binding forkhead associated (FHA) protein
LVESSRFTIGRTPENDLAIPNSNLSRRHAVIESFGGVIQITDCGSQNGTEVNGTQVLASAILHDGDMITLAGVCDIAVTIGDNGKQISQTPSISHKTSQSARQAISQRAESLHSPQRPNAKADQPWLGGLAIPLIVAATVGLALVIGCALLLLILRSDGRQSSRNSGSKAGQNVNENSNGRSETETSTAEGTPELNTGSSDSVADADKVEKVAVAVMQRISSDDKPYSFSDKALLDIGRKVNSYRNSPALAQYLESMQRNSAALGAMAREEGLEPGLLIYTVLAKTDGGRINEEPVAVARGIISDLLAVRATFGTTDAESSLILLAAYKIGGGGKRSHPLLVTIRRLVKQPLTQRNVWYLNERGGLDAEVYDFVLSFLALAVIAQNPSQFGVSASPLVF